MTVLLSKCLTTLYVTFSDNTNFTFIIFFSYKNQRSYSLSSGNQNQIQNLVSGPFYSYNQNPDGGQVSRSISQVSPIVRSQQSAAAQM